MTRPRVPALALLAALVPVLFSPPQPVQAQRGAAAAPSRGPGWLPRLSFFDRDYFSAPHTAAEQDAMIARLLETERIVLQVAELARPEGFEIEPRIYPRIRVTTRSVFQHSYELWMYNPTKAIAGEGCSCVEILVNSIHGANRSPYSDEQGEIYFEWDRGEPVPGATHVWGSLSPIDPGIVTVMFTPGGGSPWKTVTRENYLKALIVYAEGKNGEKLAETRRQHARTRYEEWLAEAATRKQQREATIAAVASVDPVQAAELRKELEAVERETGEEMKRADASDRAENARVLATLTEYGDQLRARLAAMSPAERQKPAWLDPMDWLLVEPGSPRSLRALQLDPDFYRARPSRAEAWTISVRIAARGTGATPEVQSALYAAFRKLDWAALARLLEPAPK